MYDINKCQLRLDMTLKTERTIAENVQTAIEFTMMKIIQGDPPPSAVHDHHAAYGVAAQNYAKAAASLKKIKSDMDALLDTLDDINHPASSVVDTLCSSAQRAAVTAVVMAAEMRRTLGDLCEAEKQDKHYPMDDFAAKENTI